MISLVRWVEDKDSLHGPIVNYCLGVALDFLKREFKSINYDCALFGCIYLLSYNSPELRNS